MIVSFLGAFASAGTLGSAASDGALNASWSAHHVSVTAPNDAIDLPRFLPPQPNLSCCSAEVLQLTQAGMDESVVLSFINGSGLFQLSAEHIVYLNDLGVSGKVIQAMLAHDRDSLAKPPQTTNAANVAVSVQPEPERITTAEAKPATMEVAAAARIVEAAPQVIEAGASHSIVTPPAVGMAKLDSRPQKPNPPQPASAKRKVFFPVREPYAVELTAPIVFLDAPTF
ncbi:MAG TPA: hypothetical protein VFZ59_07455 [Verrucomicrobiae bacterium]|nr:hypothetical protein [Verrucomicrobiae bacterium]